MAGEDDPGRRPAVSAVRRIAPRLPGSVIPSTTTRNASGAPIRSSTDAAGDRRREREHALRRLRRARAPRAAPRRRCARGHRRPRRARSSSAAPLAALDDPDLTHGRAAGRGAAPAPRGSPRPDRRRDRRPAVALAACGHVSGARSCRRAVLDRDAARRELVADAVGGGEVAVGAGRSGRATSASISSSSSAASLAAGANPGRRASSSTAASRARRRSRRPASSAAFAPAHRVEDRGHRRRRAEVVVHRGRERGDRRRVRRRPGPTPSRAARRRRFSTRWMPSAAAPSSVGGQLHLARGSAPGAPRAGTAAAP